MDTAGIKALTFDCYGTLIDWESGILRAMKPLLATRGRPIPDEEILTLYARFEAQAEADVYMPYRDVLAQVIALFGEHLKLELEERELGRLADSVSRWPAFADSAPALARLAAQFRLVVCSNIDDDLFIASAAKLGHTEESPLFEYVVTARYCRSYKPDPRHFRVALALLGLEPREVLHVAQSRFHDIAPARALGFRTAWVNRPSLCANVGVAPAHPPASDPDITTTDLATLARTLGV